LFLINKESQNFAREYVRNFNIDDYSGIVVVSGDGLIFEIINGLMERPDWKRAIKMPIAQIPGGSANALACCVAYITGEVFRGLSLESFATQTAFNISKSISVPLDLVRYELCDKQIIHSFLTFEWAIVADVDLESEKYRYLGGFRFLVGALKRIYSECIHLKKIVSSL
jgi:sphingosine kinase